MKTFSNKPMFVMVLLTVSSMFIVSCQQAKPAKYTIDLTYCNQTAKTCEESIECENKVRAANNRPLRDPAKGCQ